MIEKDRDFGLKFNERERKRESIFYFKYTLRKKDRVRVRKIE